MQYPSAPDQILYYEQVWKLTRQVPRAKVTTYGQLAQMLDCPPGVEKRDDETLGSRWLGAAMGACPDDVPWQRVINAQRKISTRPGAQAQRQWLEEKASCLRNTRPT
jgi:methylated-DNA-protein-cysteine methyltransferase related protein